MSLNQRQFTQLPLFAGYEPREAPQEAASAPEAPSLRMAAIRRRASSNRRHEDHEEVGLKGASGTHPMTGLPVRGEISTWAGRSAWDKKPGLGFSPPDISAVDEGPMGRTSIVYATPPTWASYGGSAPSARRKAGTVGLVPNPLLRTPQQTVSASRLHEALVDPSTRQGPQWRNAGPEHRELPYVYVGGRRGRPTAGDTYTVVDGNHRLSAERLEGRLFSEARMIYPEDKDKVEIQSTRIAFMTSRAREKKHERRKEAVRRRNGLA